MSSNSIKKRTVQVQRKTDVLCPTVAQKVRGCYEWTVRELGNRQRRKTKSLIRVVYKSTHTLLGFNRLLKYQSFI